MVNTDVAPKQLTADDVRKVAKKLWNWEPLPMVVSRQAYDYYKSLTERSK